MLVEKILNMGNEEIIGMLSQEEVEMVTKRYRTLNNFCDMYQDGARLSDEDEFVTPSEYIELMQY